MIDHLKEKAERSKQKIKAIKEELEGVKGEVKKLKQEIWLIKYIDKKYKKLLKELNSKKIERIIIGTNKDSSGAFIKPQIKVQYKNEQICTMSGPLVERYLDEMNPI